MIIFLAAIVILMISKMEISGLGEYHQDYISVERSNAIKGIFILMIFMSHYAGYTTMEGFLDETYWTVRIHFGQGVVAMYMFYSGYGILESIKKKGFDYVAGIPRNRILKVWLSMVTAIIVFLIMDWFIGYKYSLPHILLATIGYTNVNNSSWYIFAILILYVIAFLGFLIIKKGNTELNRFIGIAILLVLTAAAEYIQLKMGREPYSWNTMCLFPAGMCYSFFREKIEKVVLKNSVTYVIAFALVLAAYIYMYYHRSSHKGFAVWLALLTALILLITMKVSFKNKILEWCGKNLFWLYILQRLPMKLLDHVGLVASHKYIAFVIVIGATFLMTPVFDRFNLANLILERNKQER